MPVFSSCLAAVCSNAAVLGLPAAAAPDAAPAALPVLAYARVLDAPLPAEPINASRTNAALSRAPDAPHAIAKATAPIGHASRFSSNAIGLGPVNAFKGGKLLLTNGVASIEGASGGGLANWATIAGNQVAGGIGVSAHATAIELPDFGWRSYGAALGFGNRMELSFARVHFDTRDAGAALGLGAGYTFDQDIFGAKLRLAGDIVYGPAWLPQITAGVQHKRSNDAAVVAALGAGADQGTDFILSATKLLLAQSVLVNATLRYTEANQTGLLGFGSAAGAGARVQFEGSLAYQLSRRAVIGAEYRSKPNNLGLGEDDWMDIFAAYAVNRNLTLTAAYVDLGSIATFENQRGGFLSAQIAF